MAVPTSREQPCAYCKTNTRHDLSRSIKSNGTEQVGWFCKACRHWGTAKTGGNWIRHALLTEHGVDIRTLPIVNAAELSPCERCGSPGVELHHWAPRHIFGENEADRWPTSYLCIPCHTEWHQKAGI